jgi:hypothetical protein
VRGFRNLEASENIIGSSLGVLFLEVELALNIRLRRLESKEVSGLGYLLYG